MASRRKSRPRVPRNPLNGPVLWAWLVVLGLGALSALTDDRANLSRFLLPLTLVLGLVSFAWIVMAWRLGCVTMPSNTGRLYHYFRERDPIGFHIVILLYALLCLALVAYPASVLLGF